MIVTLANFQKGLLKIPNSIPAPNGADKTEELQDFIDRYEREILIDGLGVELFEELEFVYDALDETAHPALWKLVNGATYTTDGKMITWEGLRHKYSLLSYYIYWKFIQETADLFSTFGVERPEGKGSQPVSIIPRATAAYREFFEKYQGDNDRYLPRVIHTRWGAGLDYYGSKYTKASLHQFLRDNVIDYPTAIFTFKENINSFGL